jgi:phospholipid/cholesterol/gamma-HCH transport system substrate-binding protein
MKLSMQAKVGILALTALLILVTMVVWKGDIFLKAQGYELIGSFSNAGGVVPGAEVRYRGYKVGKVIQIDSNPQDVKVHLIIQQDIKVPEGSSLRVAFDGLIGQKYVEIIPGVSAVMLKDKSVIPGFSTLGIVDFIDIGTQNLEESKRILQSVRQVTDDPAIQQAAKQTLVNIEKTTYDINHITSGLSRSLEKGGFEDLIKSLNTASDTVNRVSKELDGIISALSQLTSDPEFTSDVKATAKNAKEAFEEFKKASADASKLMRKYSK